MAEERVGAAAAEVRRAAERFRTLAPGISSWHCFSFAGHYDPTNVAFGPLVALNDETLERGAGFSAHPHAAVEIVTWVVDGSLVHCDSTGSCRTTPAGHVQRLSAGAGVSHAETAASADPVTRFIQMWVMPDDMGGQASYQQGIVDPQALSTGYVVLASGRAADARRTGVTIARADASLLATRLAPGDARPLPVADLVHLFVVDGEIELDTGERLAAGDSVRWRSPAQVTLTGRSAAEILAWMFD